MGLNNAKAMFIERRGFVRQGELVIFNKGEKNHALYFFKKNLERG
jgi:hypothetical protein